MGFKCGIVGLPNVGKSTLFNALTETAAAQAANYPFCTIEPNVGEVAVPDKRLETLATLAKSAMIVPTRLTFVDIAGLVRGASKGEGLGNQFLANIREVDAIAHVVRCFEDSDVTHVEGRIDPVADIETVETELMLADLDSLERRVDALSKKAKGGDKEAKESLDLINRALALLRDGKPARLASAQARGGARFPYARPADRFAGALCLQCRRGVGCRRQRILEKGRSPRQGRKALSPSSSRPRSSRRLPCSRATSAPTISPPSGLHEAGLDRLIRAGYALLDLVTFFTAGPKETRAWTITRGTKAPQAAGVIHTDFEHGFIRSETIAYDDYVAFGGEAGTRDVGKMRLEGKDYVVQDGDVVHFRFAN